MHYTLAHKRQKSGTSISHVDNKYSNFVCAQIQRNIASQFSFDNTNSSHVNLKDTLT